MEREQFEKPTAYRTLDSDVSVLITGSTVTSVECKQVWGMAKQVKTSEDTPRDVQKYKPPWRCRGDS